MTACSTPWQLGTVCSFYSVAHSFGIHMYMVTTLVISVCFWCFLLFHLFLVCFVMLFNQTEIAQKGTHMACCYHWFDRNKTHRLTLSFFFFFPSFLKAPVSKIEILTLWISKLVKRWCSGVVGWVGRHPPLPFINVIRFSITSRFKSNILFSLWQQILLERWGAPPLTRWQSLTPGPEK